MATSRHETAHRIFQERPELLGPIFEILGVPPPRNPVVEELPTDATETRPLDVLARAVGKADQETGDYFATLLTVGLGDTPAGWTWRELMSMPTYFPGRSTFLDDIFLKGEDSGEARGEARGEAKGEAKQAARAVLRVLERREVPVSGEVRDRVTDCSDLELLDSWFDRAFTVARAEDIFADDE